MQQYGEKSLQEPSSASSSRNAIGENTFYEGISNNPREPEAEENHISGKYDVTIQSVAVKSQAHLEPVFSNGGRKYRVLEFKNCMLAVFNLNFLTSMNILDPDQLKKSEFSS